MKFNKLRHWRFATALVGSSLLATSAAGTPAHTSFSRSLRACGGTTHAPRDLEMKPPRSEPVTCGGGTYIVEVDYGDDSNDGRFDSYVSCETSDGKSYRVNGLPDSVENAIRTTIPSGIRFDGRMPELRLPEGIEVNESTATIDLPAGEALSFEAPREDGVFDRRNLAVTGTRSVLVVRVIAMDASTTQSVERLSDSVFGNGANGPADPVTMRSQYLACSYDQLEFVEANDRDGTSTNIRNGTCEKLCLTQSYTASSVKKGKPGKLTFSTYG